MVLPYMIDRSLLCRSAVALPDRSGVTYILSADYSRDSYRWNWIFCFSLCASLFHDHTQAAGIGAIFDWFRGMDAPYNLFPSLHAALWLLLVDIYARHLRGIFPGRRNGLVMVTDRYFPRY